MIPTFNLLSEPWIPCLRRDGSLVELGLRDVLVAAHELREAAAESPPLTASLYRLLLTVLYRVLRPSDVDAWEELWRAGRWPAARIEAYLQAWAGRFDLFDAARPFLQLADARVKSRSIACLLPEAASGNNATLFSHQTDEGELMVSPAQAARILLGAQTFGVGGLSGIAQKFTDAPCASGITFLAEGDTLFETLALNLARYPWVEGDPRIEYDRPAWEADDATLPERDLPWGDLDGLTWYNRRILLLPETHNGSWCVRRVTVAPALRLQPGALDPMIYYRIDEKLGPRPVGFDESRALWRDSAVLLSLGSDRVRPARVVEWLSLLVQEQVLDRARRFRLMALGMAKSRAKVEFYRAERLPLPLEYLARRELVDVVQEAISLAEAVAAQLWAAARTLASLTISPEADLDGSHAPSPDDCAALMAQWRIEQRYWGALEIPFRALLASIPDQPEHSRLTWRTTLREAAWGALGQVASWLEHAPRSMKAVVAAQARLSTGLARVLSTRGGEDEPPAEQLCGQKGVVHAYTIPVHRLP